MTSIQPNTWSLAEFNGTVLYCRVLFLYVCNRVVLGPVVYVISPSLANKGHKVRCGLIIQWCTVSTVPAVLCNHFISGDTRHRPLEIIFCACLPASCQCRLDRPYRTLGHKVLVLRTQWTSTVEHTVLYISLHTYRYELLSDDDDDERDFALVSTSYGTTNPPFFLAEFLQTRVSRYGDTGSFYVRTTSKPFWFSRIVILL